MSSYREKKVQVIGPAPAGIGRIAGQYRTVFYGKCSDMTALIYIKDRLEAFLDEQKTQGESVQFDFDPMNSY